MPSSSAFRAIRASGIEAALGALAMVGPDSKDKAVLKIPGLEIKEEMIAGRYRIEKLLGAGSSGFVVAARHVYLRRRVTLKILSSTTNTHHRAQRRHLAIAHQAAALRGPHVARIVDTGFTEDGTPFIATERLEGRTLAEELAARGSLPAVEAVGWILQACEGLAEAHAAKIVHGDLKPQNMFLAGDLPAGTLEGIVLADTRILKILDFGMATPVDEGPDEGTSAWFASPAYLSPEQIRDPAAVDERTDVWALGVILHHLVSGALPFAADTVSGMLVAVAYDEPALLTGQDVPFELARVVQSCLAKQREARPPNMAALARALAPFAGADGLAMASRVDAALSTPPPMALSSSIAPAAAPSPATRNAAVQVVRPPLRRAPEADSVAGEVEDLAAFRRRRRGALAMAAVTTALAVAGLLAPTPQSEAAPTAVVGNAARANGGAASPASTPTEATLPSIPAVATVPSTPEASPAVTRIEAPHPVTPSEGSPTARVQPSFALGVDEPSATLDASTAPAAPAPEPTPPVAPRRTEPITVPGARTAAKELPPGKPRSSLAVREDPYVQGFTHPTRLSERRK